MRPAEDSQKAQSMRTRKKTLITRLHRQNMRKKIKPNTAPTWTDESSKKSRKACSASLMNLFVAISLNPNATADTHAPAHANSETKQQKWIPQPPWNDFCMKPGWNGKQTGARDANFPTGYSTGSVQIFFGRCPLLSSSVHQDVRQYPARWSTGRVETGRALVGLVLPSQGRTKQKAKIDIGQ